MRNILLVTVNTLRVTFRARSKILVYFLVPVLGVVLSFFISGIASIEPVRIGVVDNDSATLSGELVKSLSETGGFRTTAVERKALDGLLTDGALDAGLIIPSGYSGDTLNGKVAVIEIVSLKGESVTAWLEQFVNLFSSTAAALATAAGGDRSTFEAMYAEATQKGVRLSVESLPDVSAGRRTTISSVGYLVLFTMVGAGITMQLVLEDRRKKTYSRIKAAPVRASQYIAGNGAAGFLIVLVQVVLVLLVMRLVFRVETYVPDMLLFVILVAFGLVAVGFAMAITAFSRSSAGAIVLLNLIAIPTSMIAGCFWPAEFMPPLLQRLALFLPQRWVLDAIERTQTGASVGEIAIHLLVIVGFALALFLAASLRFSRLEESGQFV